MPRVSKLDWRVDYIIGSSSAAVRPTPREYATRSRLRASATLLPVLHCTPVRYFMTLSTTSCAAAPRQDINAPSVSFDVSGRHVSHRDSYFHALGVVLVVFSGGELSATT